MREGGLGWGVVRAEQDAEGIDTEQPGRNVSAPSRMSMAPPPHTQVMKLRDSLQSG